MTMSFTLKYTGSCPDPAERLAGTSLPARAPLWFPALAGEFGEGWRSTGGWEKMGICCCLPSPLPGMEMQKVPTAGSSHPWGNYLAWVSADMSTCGW